MELTACSLIQPVLQFSAKLSIGYLLPIFCQVDIITGRFDTLGTHVPSRIYVYCTRSTLVAQTKWAVVARSTSPDPFGGETELNSTVLAEHELLGNDGLLFP